MAYAAFSVVYGETPTAAKWNILGTNDLHFDSLIGLDGGKTIIGANDVRATRYVALVQQVALVAAVNPGSTDWVDVDATAATSANCFAVNLRLAFNSATIGRILYLRENGSPAAAGSTTQVLRNMVVSVPFPGTAAVGVDAGQVFEYSVNNTDVSYLDIYVTGYWEYVD